MSDSEVLKESREIEDFGRGLEVVEERAWRGGARVTVMEGRDSLEEKHLFLRGIIFRGLLC